MTNTPNADGAGPYDPPVGWAQPDWAQEFERWNQSLDTHAGWNLLHAARAFLAGQFSEALRAPSPAPLATGHRSELERLLAFHRSEARVQHHHGKGGEQHTRIAEALEAALGAPLATGGPYDPAQTQSPLEVALEQVLLRRCIGQRMDGYTRETAHELAALATSPTRVGDGELRFVLNQLWRDGAVAAGLGLNTFDQKRADVDRALAALRASDAGGGPEATYAEAKRLATEVGYVLVPEPEHPDSPHAPPPPAAGGRGNEEVRFSSNPTTTNGHVWDFRDASAAARTQDGGDDAGA